MSLQHWKEKILLSVVLFWRLVIQSKGINANAKKHSQEGFILKIGKHYSKV